MNIIRYSIQSAIASIWREKWINLLAVLSISIGLSILCLFMILTVNLDYLLHNWSRNFGIVAYLQNDIDKAEERVIYNSLMKDKDILKVSYISREQAIKEVSEALGEDAIILDAFGDNPLPASFEIKLKSNMLNPGAVRIKAGRISKIRGVQEVQYAQKWLASLYSLARSMKIGSLVIVLIIFVAITFITYSTIKIFFYRRQDEVETLKLLGATKGFIRLPFIIEGFFIGIVGGCVSAFVLFGAYSLTMPRITEFFPSMKNMIVQVPLITYLFIPVFGSVMSIIGSFLAIGRIRY